MRGGKERRGCEIKRGTHAAFFFFFYHVLSRVVVAFLLPISIFVMTMTLPPSRLHLGSSPSSSFLSRLRPPPSLLELFCRALYLPSPSFVLLKDLSLYFLKDLLENKLSGQLPLCHSSSTLFIPGSLGAGFQLERFYFKQKSV